MSPARYGNTAGVAAVLSWGTLGVLGKFAQSADPRLVLGLCFAIAALIGGVTCLVARRRLSPHVHKQTFLFAALLTAYHLIYFASFSYAPALHVSLINFLWPALLILLGNLFFRLDSGWSGYSGAALGFAGVAVLMLGDAHTNFEAEAVVGYLMAFAGAVLWALFSNLRRTDQADPIASMTLICLISSALCLATASIDGGTLAVPSSEETVTIVLLGLGPAGGAFFLWDFGMKRGNAAALAIFGYSAPVISTILMVLLGFGEPRWNVALAALLIASGGAIVGLGDRHNSARSLS
jgi:drug/metabolite transporter (DMT)-like permease